MLISMKSRIPPMLVYSKPINACGTTGEAYTVSFVNMFVPVFHTNAEDLHRAMSLITEDQDRQKSHHDETTPASTYLPCSLVWLWVPASSPVLSTKLVS